jgi:hypothetical protein
MGGACGMFGVQLEGRGSLGRRTHRWQDNIKINLKEIACEGIGYVNRAQDAYKWRAVANTLMNLLFP